MANAVIYGPTITPGELALSILVCEGDVREDPPGSNRGPRVDAYLRCCGLDPGAGHYPWCAAAVSWAIREAGLRLAMLKFRGSASVEHMLEMNRALEVPMSERRNGDVLVHIHAEGNHTGFYVRESGKPGLVISHEGNTDESGGRTGGRLMSKTRDLGYWTNCLRVA